MKKHILEKIRPLFLIRKIRNVGNYLQNTYIKERKIDKKYSALILAPHQDDESIGCGGTVKLITNQGVADVVYMTKGEAGARKGESLSDSEKKHLIQIRNKEAQKACNILGVREIYHLDGHDGSLGHETDLYKKLLTILEMGKYDIIFCPWKYDGHPDHMATFKIMQKALKRFSGNSEIWLYEVWTPVLANCAINISEVLEDKMKAIQAHESQVKIIDYPQKARGLSVYRSVHMPEAEFAEAFLCGNKKFILSL